MSTLGRQYSKLKKVSSNVFKPDSLRGELHDSWFVNKKQLNIDRNPFIEMNTSTDDPMLLMRQSRLFNVREEAYKASRERQIEMLDDLENNNTVEKIPSKWEHYVDDIRKATARKAELEYNQLSRWKVRTEELRPDREVYPYDYLWLMYAVKCKMTALELHTLHYFPMQAVIKGIKNTALHLLNIKDPPPDEWFESLCPWFQYHESIDGYPKCLTPTQAFTLFRHAGYNLALRIKEEDPNEILGSALMYGYLFEKLAADPRHIMLYTNHWSRSQLLTNAPRHPISSKNAELISRTHNAFPAFKAQQAWWYSQPDRLREENIDEGIYFHQVPSVRHTLMAGVPTLRNYIANAAADMLWYYLNENIDVHNPKSFSELSDAVTEAEQSQEAVQTVMSELKAPKSVILQSEDLTIAAPSHPNEYYDETYRPILRYEIERAAAEGLHLPSWYSRRQRELAEGPFAALVPDLKSGSQTDFTFEDDFEVEVEGKTADQNSEQAAAEEEETVNEEGQEIEYRDGLEDASIPLVERLRISQLETAVRAKDETKFQELMSDEAVDTQLGRREVCNLILLLSTAPEFF